MRNPRILFLACALFLESALGGPKAGGRATPHVRKLRCEYLTEPIGVDTPRPRLSWIVESSFRSEEQIAYRIQVASGRDLLLAGRPDLWDTGRVERTGVFQVAYGGKPLESRKRYFWRVRVWCLKGGRSPWSEPSFWEMGFLDPRDWKAKWISDGKPLPARDEDFYAPDPAPLMRKTFRIEKKVARARLYITGLGYYEAFLNGKRIGDHVLDPLWTSYSKRVLYSVYDVKDCLVRGENVLGATLGNGWYNPLPLRMWGRINLRKALPVGRPKLLAQLEVFYEDGSVQTVLSDETWKTAEGPLLRNNVYLGELYDARLEKPGWLRPGFDDSKWKNVQVARAPAGRLSWQALPPIRVIERLEPAAVTEPRPGVFIFDFGRNFAGWARLRVRGPRGTVVRMRYGELLHEDGTLNVMTSVCGQIKRPGLGGPGAPPVAYQCDTYILKGSDGPEVYTPRFTFHGFRYVEVTGYPGRPPEDALTGLLLCCDLERSGRFTCSNEVLNRIERMAVNTFRSNLFGVQSDCPHREKFGYGGDIVASRHAFLFTFDMSSFYSKVVRDFADARRPNGAFTETAPYVGIASGGFGGGSGPIGWAVAHPLLLEDLLCFYGEKRIVREQFDNAKKWLDFIHSKVPDLIVRRGISDHESLVKKPVPVTGTAFFHQAADTLSRLARWLGRDSEAQSLGKLASAIGRAFRARFIKNGGGRVFTGTQACQATALYHGLATGAEKEAVLSALRRRIESDGGKLTTGIFGTKYLLEVLSRNGLVDTAYKIVTHEDFPGWVYMLKHGATTLWEHWRFSDNVYSHNHPMFGSVVEWFYRHLAGINPSPEAVGFKKVEIRPQIPKGLKWVEAVYDSIRGPLEVRWRLKGERFELEIRVPVGIEAVLFLPKKGAGSVTESGVALKKAPGIKRVVAGRNRLRIEIGSGVYRFDAPYKS